MVVLKVVVSVLGLSVLQVMLTVGEAWLVHLTLVLVKVEL